MAQKRILLVEDEPHLAFNMELNLREEGYDVVLATDGDKALACYTEKGPFSLIILDVMLPGKNGLEVAQDIRSHDKTTGILMLTARAAESDILTGLEKGADDYMTKPFSLQELLLRVKRMADRSELFMLDSTKREREKEEEKGKDYKISFADVLWNPKTFELTSGQGHFVLTALEAKVLREFLLHPGEILTRQHLLSQVWGLSGNVETRTVDNFIMRLRKFFEVDPSKPQLLQSMRGRGYKFCAKIEKVGE
jgi:two-component system alkaline phosphatase synthesis response regulator PhoP